MNDKIALEEHWVPRGLDELITNPGFPPEAWRQIIDRLTDVSGRRLEEMDRHGIGYMVLSLGSDGLQAIVDADAARDMARRANDELADAVSERPDRFGALAALPMQRPQDAAAELARAVDDLGMRGALVNGFSDTADQQGLYYDAPEFDDLWAVAEARGVPIYLHPRNPLRSQRRIYEGRPELLGPTWAFGVETATHALRLITGGVFDRFPKLNVVLGHLGETLPFTMIRLEQRLGRTAGVRLERSPTTVLAENFHITTSGNYDTATFLGVMLQLGSDRLLFSADYPFEDMADGATWFDALPLSSGDRQRIGRTNAQRLLGLAQ